MIPSNNRTKSGIIFIFERASLVPALVGKAYQILNPDDHANFLRRHKKNPYDYRPEIIYQVLLEVADSKLYQSGLVQAIYVKTDEGLLMKIEPHMLIPETFEKFCALMLKLLQKFSIRARGKREKLLRLIANPVTQHLPSNCYKIGLSFSSEKRVHLRNYVGALNDDVNLVFVVGAMAHGKINCDYTDDIVSGNTLLNYGFVCGIYQCYT
ncbi:hypothetical protein AQUCO_07500032v1 [Aquilegia coerulea]|uniref:Ribosomal RNA small subunit methyltransferase NEP1 n=1 Tax=Aquilegia coerulea TaxID=218851 RepID=A0A2G5C992_AQUCA|nr:hypothetical protein AQUCO_07500032v1 [Aquilegia coerulea]